MRLSYSWTSLGIIPNLFHIPTSRDRVRSLQGLQIPDSGHQIGHKLCHILCPPYSVCHHKEQKFGFRILYIKTILNRLKTHSFWQVIATSYGTIIKHFWRSIKKCLINSKQKLLAYFEWNSFSNPGICKILYFWF